MSPTILVTYFWITVKDFDSYLVQKAYHARLSIFRRYPQYLMDMIYLSIQLNYFYA